MYRADARHLDTVNWSKNPRIRLRFLDWIDAHERERSVLFAPPSSPTARRGRNTLTKRSCTQRAAEYVFVDEDADEDSRRLVKEDSAHLGDLIYFYIRNLCAYHSIACCACPLTFPAGAK